MRAAITFSLFALLAAPAGAALEKYSVRSSSVLFSTNTSPQDDFFPNLDQRGEPNSGVAVIDDSGALPVLVKLRPLTDTDVTVDVPGLSGFIWVSRKFTDGPALNQTGVSGDTSSQIAWGTVTGWQISGQNWCNSEPATICFLAGDGDEDTVDPEVNSPFYDIGTWIFHGTGFTAIPYVYSRLTSGGPNENQQVIYRASLVRDGTVPALPLAGVALLSGGLLAAALAGLRRR